MLECYRMKYLIWTLLAVCTLYLAMNLHSRTGYFNYKSELFADKVGYYVYLPATFVYGFDADAVPDDLPMQVGCGFFLDHQDKIYTKYPIGVAVLQAPFFLITHYIIAPLSGYATDGFSAPYHKMIDVAAWAYMLLGLMLLAKVLAAYFKPTIVGLTLLAFLAGTNLFYYYAVESGMSHVYSFFLAAALLRLTQVVHRRARVTPRLALLIGAVAGLLVLTRFMNVLLLSILLFWEVGSLQALKSRIRLFLSGPVLLALFAVPAVLIAAQMMYYNYLTGSPFHYAYEGEGFDFLHPELLKFWFSPHNGLFIYAPIMAFALIGTVRMMQQRLPGGWLLIVLFAVPSMVFASWWEWYFGCAHGARSFVEYYPLFMIAFAYFLEWIASKSVPWQIFTSALILPLVVLTFKNGYLYRLCYLGQGDWDWGYLVEMACRF